ncbi:MAG TPA: helix-turn-helix domain-containing protein [Nocardioidaceae bacterium]|nr:helix-turn-helix domain-containing protein [Nocardioidaceae bacterium]
MSGEVGGRIRDLRGRRGISQTTLAAEAGISGSYLSLIESGRRPVGSALLARFSVLLGCTAEYLQTGRGGTADDTAEIDLRFAELALRSGDAETALDRFTAVLNQSDVLRRPDLAADARWGIARAKEAIGMLEDAVTALEGLLDGDRLPAGASRTALTMHLCRVYSECGDLSHAIEVGEAGLREIEANESAELAGDEVVALASTLVGCYYERGDLTRAHTLAKTWIERSEQGGSPLARASALWNAGLVAEARGDIRSAIRYLDRALALYGENDNSRALSFLKVAAAFVMLRSPEPPLADAERLLMQARDELGVDGTSVEIAYAETELARCRLLEGNPAAAIGLAEAAIDRLGPHPRLERAQALVVVGAARLDEGDDNGAIASYELAAADLKNAGADRQAASVWRELAEALAKLGRPDEALQAYRRAADSAGVSRVPERAESSRADSVSGAAARPGVH